MVNTSKILTVSYGTFSCTLEGFDDSFDTMKAIAEYFRDLASDDRYFGAEPPTPDAEMLARIAEREITRRVEAHEDQGKIVLRATSDATLTAPEPTVTEVPPESAELLQEEAPAANEDPIKVEPEQVTETIVTEEAPEPIEVAEIIEEVVETNESTEPVEEDVSEIAEEASETSAVHVESVEAPVELADDIQPEESQDPDSIASKLRRIRSVVLNPEQAYETDEFNEDEHAQDFLDSSATDLEAVLTADDEGSVVMTSEVSEVEATDAVDSSALMAEDTVPPEEEADTTLADDTAEEYEVEIAEDTLAQLLADAIPTDTAQDDLVDYQEDSDLDEDQPLNARVIKMPQGDLDAAISQGYLEEELPDDNDDSDLNVFEDDTQNSTLSVEDENDLQRELAEVEAELGSDNEDDGVDVTEHADDALPNEDHDELDKDGFEDDLVASDDVASEEDDSAQDDDQAISASRLNELDQAEGQSDLERIFDEADHHLEEPESHQRRNAIQHLRAAVAATRAEKKAGADLQKNVDDTPYRTDLAEVVRPRRPHAAEGIRLARPEENRPAPLKLVAEQRVDAPRDPIRPRRVSAAAQKTDTNEQVTNSAGSGFTEFAEEMGVTRLPELLEAAAAYMSDVEGRPQFSRPMLMGKLKEVSKDNYSREDGLRSFGQLLRLGKIQKLKGGRFAVTEETEYRANDERHAG